MDQYIICEVTDEGLHGLEITFGINNYMADEMAESIGYDIKSGKYVTVNLTRLLDMHVGAQEAAVRG